MALKQSSIHLQQPYSGLEYLSLKCEEAFGQIAVKTKN